MKRNVDRKAGYGPTLLEVEPEPASRPEKVRKASPAVGKGILTGIDASGFPLVIPEDASSPIAARHVCPLTPADAGREAILAFEGGDPLKPIIIGLLQPPVAEQAPPVAVSLDDEELSLTAKEKIVLRCGKASITLTRAGKVIIRGAYVLSRSSGVNRVKGGSVQIN